MITIRLVSTGRSVIDAVLIKMIGVNKNYMIEFASFLGIIEKATDGESNEI